MRIELVNRYFCNYGWFNIECLSLQATYAAANQQVISNMAQLEPMLTQLLIERL